MDSVLQRVMNARLKKAACLGLLLTVALPGLTLADATSGLYPGTGWAEGLELRLPFAQQSPLLNARDRSQGLLALKWQHHLNQAHTFTLAAGYGDDVYLEETPYETVSTMASLSWTRQWGPRMSLTGSLFVGDEEARDDVFQHLEREYFGFSLGGRLQVFERHSPFLSFRMLRSDYDDDVTADPLASSTEYSHLTAGWDWQVRPNWRLRASADYTLENLSLDLDRYDRSRIVFSTRFDFR